jgi:hypothetical protein
MGWATNLIRKPAEVESDCRLAYDEEIHVQRMIDHRESLFHGIEVADLFMYRVSKETCFCTILSSESERSKCGACSPLNRSSIIQ